MKIGIIGYGELGRQIENLLIEDGVEQSQIYYFDDFFSVDQDRYFPFEFYKKTKFKELFFLIGLGYKHLPKRLEICRYLVQERNLLTFIHPTCYVSPKASIKSGTIAYPMCNIDKGVTLGNGVILNNSVVISHDSIIGDASYISPACILSGNVFVGEGCFLGSGVLISNNVRVGDHTNVGIGSVVTKDLPQDVFAIGNPVKIKPKPFNIQ